MVSFIHKHTKQMVGNYQAQFCGCGGVVLRNPDLIVIRTFFFLLSSVVSVGLVY